MNDIKTLHLILDFWTGLAWGCVGTVWLFMISAWVLRIRDHRREYRAYLKNKEMWRKYELSEWPERATPEERAAMTLTAANQPSATSAQSK